MNPSDVSNDYSFFVHSIEGKLTSAASSSSNKTNASAKTGDENAALDTATRQGFPAKRKRASEFVIEDLDDDSLLASTAAKTAASSAPRSVSSTMKIQVQLDEYKLLNEQLKEQLRTYKDEHDLFKEQSIRQLKYLEDQNTRYKSQYKQSSQKYYKEKKEWQGKVRELEHSLDLAQKSNSSVSSSTASNKFLPAVVHELTSDEEKEYRHQILELKETLVEKSQEASNYFTAKLDLEKKVYQLEQEVKCLKSTSSNDEETLVELRTLRKKCSDLETTLRRKSREYDKYDQKLKNQAILEEQVATASQKLTLAQNSIKSYQAMENQYNQLVEDKKVWSQLFANIISQQPSEEDGGSSSSLDHKEECTPSRVLHMLHTTQQSLLVLQQQHAELQNSTVGLRRQLLKAEAQCKEYEGKLVHHTATIQQLESKLNQSTSYMKCFEGEIASLRSLLTSYDSEFNFGRPQESKMLQLKETTIADLRSELDQARTLLQTYKAQVEQLQAELESAQQQAQHRGADASGEAVTESEKYLALREDFEALQEITGMDHLPHKTRVLHFAENPASLLMQKHLAATSHQQQSQSAQQRSSLPMEVIQRLQQEVKALKASVNHHGSAADAVAAAADSNSGDASLFVDMNRSTFASTATTGNGNSGGSSSSAVVDHAKLNIRLKEIFKEKIQSYREAVYLLTGYKMELYTEDPGNPSSLPRIRLRSMYAESPDDCLIFQVSFMAFIFE
jgi:mitotic spindle assembly checkpoint protein MAD1